MDSSQPHETKTAPQPFRIADWEIVPASNRIRHGNTEVKLEPRVMQLLLYLASRPSEVFTREEIEKHVWAGMVVGYDSLTSAMIKLRKAFGDDSHHPQIIETVAKRGYRLIAAVSTDNTDISASRQKVFPLQSVVVLRQLSWVSLIIIVGLLATLFWLWHEEEPITAGGSHPAEKPSIAVLPFTNLTADAEQEYFIDGITEDLITDLSNISGLSVIASNTVFTYKGQSPKPQEIANELGVNYLLEGSVRRAGERIRINAQLVDTHNGYQLWAKRYDRKLAEIFVVQDEVANSIVNALALHLNANEQALFKNKATLNFQAYDLFLQGQKLFKERTKESLIDAAESYRQAIKLDPDYARAYGALAVVYTSEYARGWAEFPVETLDRALNMAQTAAALDDTSPQVYWALGYVYLFRKEFKQAALAAEKSIAIAPSYADGYGLLAFINNHRDKSKEALKLIEKGIQLNPYYSWDYPFNRGWAQYTLGQYQDAVTSLQEALDQNQNAVFPRLYLAASYVRLGQLDDAEWEVEQVQVNNSLITHSHLKRTLSIENPAQKAAFLDDLRQAGLPE